MRFTIEALLVILGCAALAVGAVWWLKRRASLSEALPSEPPPPTLTQRARRELPPTLTHPSPWVSPASTVKPARTGVTVPATSSPSTTGKGSFEEEYTKAVASKPQTTYRKWQEQQASIVADYLTVGGAPRPQPKATYLKDGRGIEGATLMGVPIAEIRGKSKPVPTTICTQLMRQGYSRYEAGEIYARSGAAAPDTFKK